MSHNDKNLSDLIREHLQRLASDEAVPRQKIEEILERINSTKINILLVGSTGAGKSSTINALFKMNEKGASDDVEIAAVGREGDPETKSIECYPLNNVILWDSPGLGDSTEEDEKHLKLIREKMEERDSNGELLVDLVLLILDGSNRDMKSAYALIDEVLPFLGDKPDRSERLLVAINQADLAMKGAGWDSERNCPTSALEEALKKRVQSVRDRIRSEHRIEIEPIYYSAGRRSMDGDFDQEPYNALKLFELMLSRVQLKKRIAFLNDINKNEENFRYNDNSEEYAERIAEQTEKSWWENLKDIAIDVAKEVGEGVKKLVNSPEFRAAALTAITNLLRKK